MNDIDREEAEAIYGKICKEFKEDFQKLTKMITRDQHEKEKVDAISDIMAEYFDDSILFRDVMSQIDNTAKSFVRNHIALMVENAYHRGGINALREINEYREKLRKEYEGNEGKVSD